MADNNLPRNPAFEPRVVFSDGSSIKLPAEATHSNAISAAETAALSMACVDYVSVRPA